MSINDSLNQQLKDIDLNQLDQGLAMLIRTMLNVYATASQKLEEQFKQLEEQSKQLEEQSKNLEDYANLIETLNEKLTKAIQENKDLKNEINKLKGEHGTPSFQDSKKNNRDISSETERNGSGKGTGRGSGRGSGNGRSSKKNQNKKKKKDIPIDQIVSCPIDKSTLPADAIYKGTRPVIVQNIKIITDNIQFDIERYYSPSLNKTFEGELPKGYDEGGYGPDLKSHVITSYFDGNMSEEPIMRFLNTHGIEICKQTVCNIINNKNDVFHQEKDDITETGLKFTKITHADESSGKHHGLTVWLFILCHPELFSSYFTMPDKSKLSMLKVISNNKLFYTFNEESLSLMDQEKAISNDVVRNIREEIKKLKNETNISDNLDEEIAYDVINKASLVKFISKKTRKSILTIAGTYYYRSVYTQLRIFVTDDSKQAKNIFDAHMLCLIHEARNYKKMLPALDQNKKRLADFLRDFWIFYRKLLSFQNWCIRVFCRNNKEKIEQDRDKNNKIKEKIINILEYEFDRLFTRKTGYSALDLRIASTREKKNNLLVVLKYFYVSLHNNPSEQGIRRHVRKRDVSLHTMSQAGLKAKDTFMTIIETCKKHGVNVHKYLLDRMKGTFKMPSLAQLIEEKSKTLPENISQIKRPMALLG